MIRYFFREFKRSMTQVPALSGQEGPGFDRTVAAIARRGGALTKVIRETALLTDAEKIVTVNQEANTPRG
jgi:hypothetical protein